MPRATLATPRVLEMLGRPTPWEGLAELLASSKAEVASASAESLTLEATADRIDLLCEAGIGLHAQGALGAARGLPKVARLFGLDPAPAIRVDRSVGPIRPSIAAVVVRAPAGAPLTEGLIDEAVRFQELLHATVGFDRRSASLGLYPYERLRPPLSYRSEPRDSVSITPLDGAAEVPAVRFLEEHPLAQRFGALGTRPGEVLTLRDAAGALLSLPPILNARPAGEIRPGGTTVLIESTGTRPARVADALGLLTLVFAARGWSIAPVRVEHPGRIDDGESLVEPRTLALSEATLRRMSGRPYPASEVEHLLATVRLSARATPGGWSVDVPTWRPDLQSEVDLVEEVVLARGVRSDEGAMPSSPLRGRRSATHRFHRTFGELLLGAGYSELRLPVLVPEASVRRLGRLRAVPIDHPVSEQFARLRDALQISLLGALSENRRNPYPQRFFEIGPVVTPDPSAETGAATRRRAGALLASETAGFADVASLADYLLGAFGAAGVREAADLPGTITGRAAEVRIAGERVAELGEFHPSVLEELGVPVPAAWVEIDLTTLWPLVRRSPPP